MKTKVWDYDSFPVISVNDFKIIIIIFIYFIRFFFENKCTYPNNFVSSLKKKIGKKKRLINEKQIEIMKLIIFYVKTK